MTGYLTHFLTWSTLESVSNLCALLLPILSVIWVALHFYTKALKFNPKGMNAFEREITSRLKLLFFSIRNRSFQEGRPRPPNEPPWLAESLVGLFAKKRYRNAILRDLAEDFDCDLASGMSLRRARRRYRAAALNSIGPQALAAIKRFGLVGLVFDYARRWMG